MHQQVDDYSLKTYVQINSPPLCYTCGQLTQHCHCIVEYYDDIDRDHYLEGGGDA